MKTFIRLASLTGLALGAATTSLAGSAGAVGPHDGSRGDPAVFALLANQGIEPTDVLERGTTLTRLCDIRFKDGRTSYSLYWLEHRTQAAVVVHGRAEIIAISRAGNVLGTYGSDISEIPRCDGHSVVRTVDWTGRQTSAVAPDRVPPWLGEDFSAAARYRAIPSVDGVVLPRPVAAAER